jgi:hypothetical protein
VVSKRKALFIATWGLSGLVLKDDSKQQHIAKATDKQTRAKKQTRPKKQTKVTASRKTARRPTSGAARRPTSQSARRSPSQSARRPTTPAARRPMAQAARRPMAQETGSTPQARPSQPANPRVAGPAAVAQQSGPATGTINELERLAILHGRGVLTNDEFSRAKARILETGPAAREASGAPAAFPAIAANVAAARHLTGSAAPDRGAPTATEMRA